MSLLAWLPALEARADAAPGAPEGAPGFATVKQCRGALVVLVADREAKAPLARLVGRTIVLRRPVGEPVREPFTGVVIRQEWQENGTASVCRAAPNAGELHATLTWEDAKARIQPGHRAELIELPPDARRPVILSLRCRPSRTRAGRVEVAPGQTVWLEADTLCPDGRQVVRRWTAEAGDFVRADGQPAGREVVGPRAVRWRAPSGPDGSVPKATTVRLTVGVPGQETAQTEVLQIAIPASNLSYAPATVVPSGSAGSWWSRSRPVLGEFGPLAVGPMGTFCCADEKRRRLIWWTPLGPLYTRRIRSKPVRSMNSYCDTVFYLQESTLRLWKHGTDKPYGEIPFRGADQLVDFQFAWAKDIFGVDRGDPTRLLFLREHKMDPVAVPLSGPDAFFRPAALAIDPHTNDAYVLDAEKQVAHVWRFLTPDTFTVSLRRRGILIDARAGGGDAAPPVALASRPNCDRRTSLPIRLAFANGAVAQEWTRDAHASRWRPVIAGPPQALRRFKFRVQRARALLDGNTLLSGRAEVAGRETAAVARVSPRGEFMGLLPFPQLPPVSVAAAPDGACYVLLGRRGSQRIVQVSPDGWLLRDLGAPKNWGRIIRLRADRASSRRLLLYTHSWGSRAVIRFDLDDPTRSVKIEMTIEEARLRSIFRHSDFVAADVASTDEHILVVGNVRGNSRVYLWTNEVTPQYHQHFDTGARSEAICVVFGVDSGVRNKPRPFSYFCLLSSAGSRSLRVWEYNPRYAGNPTARELGGLPPPRATEPSVYFSAIAAMASGFPEQAKLLYVLDRGRRHVHVFDMLQVAQALRDDAPLVHGAKPCLVGAPSNGEPGSCAVGPGQVIYVADPKASRLFMYERRP